MNWDAYVRLTALMAMEYAVWAAWMPVLAIRLLGPLKMTGKQTGWIYATLPLACIFAPLASGYLADKWLNAEIIILASHAIGCVLLVIAARQSKFWGMFWTMFFYSICYTATLPLVNKMVFQQLPSEAALVFLGAPLAWAAIGYLLTGFRRWRRIGGDGPDSLYLAAILSAVMVVVCFFQMPLRPASAGNPMIDALAMLKNSNYLIFILVQLAVSGMMQFYFLGTGQFMQDRGIHGKNVSALMAFAQAAQAAATYFLLIRFRENLGDQWTFVVGDFVLDDALFGVCRGKVQPVDWFGSGVPRTGVRVLHDRRANVRQRHGAERDRRLGPIVDLHRHQRHRAISRNATRGSCHAAEFRGRKVPVVEDLGRSAGRHTGRGRRVRDGVQGSASRPSQVRRTK